MRNLINSGQGIEDKKDLHFFSQLLFILFYLGINDLSFEGYKDNLERRETILFKKMDRDDNLT